MTAGLETLWELLWVPCALNFDISIVQKVQVPEINMKHQVALSKKILEGLYILEELYILGRQNKIEGQRHFRYKVSSSCVPVASPFLDKEPLAALGSVYEESGCDGFKNKSQ